MSLWGCDCPLLALVACHQRGMFCSRLSLFSPLFCAWAWQCLSLGLAFRVVVIPQSGLLAQVSSLRLPSQHPGQILTLGNAACASLPSPCLLVVGACVCLQLTSTSGSWQLFAGKRLSQPGGGRKFFPRVCWIPKLGFLTYSSTQTFLIVKNVLIVMVLILINRDVLEPSCNDLKFTTWNHNYFHTNLVYNSLEVELLGQRAVYLMSFRL